ncbi:MAG: hypothetical protein KGL39_34405 [Patescibacteria group bacterium]|nr:hypothetical protein [Patescibacteria group bacterium]
MSDRCAYSNHAGLCDGLRGKGPHRPCHCHRPHAPRRSCHAFVPPATGGEIDSASIDLVEVNRVLNAACEDYKAALDAKDAENEQLAQMLEAQRNIAEGWRSKARALTGQINRALEHLEPHLEGDSA